MSNYCQVCGSPLLTDASRGTEANGQYSRDFCSNCYHGGQFSGDVQNASNAAMYMAPVYPGLFGYTGYNLH